MRNEDFTEEPIVFHVGPEQLCSLHVPWIMVAHWANNHDVQIVPDYNRYISTLLFPSREVYLAFINEFPEILAGTENL